MENTILNTIGHFLKSNCARIILRTIIIISCLTIIESPSLPAQCIVTVPCMNLRSLSDCEEYFREAERLYDIDASLLAAIAALESGWGTSKLAKERNNLFGYCAYDGTDKATHFETKRDSILTAAKTIKEYFDNGYNLDTIPWASDPDWAKKVREIQKEIGW